MACDCEAGLPTTKVTVVDAAAPLRLTCPLPNVHTAEAGNPEQDNATDPENPLCGVRVIPTDTDELAALDKVTAFVATARLNVGEGGGAATPLQ